MVIAWKKLHKVFIETNKYKLQDGSQSKVQNDLQGFNRNADILSERVEKKRKQNKEQQETPYTRNVAVFDKRTHPDHDIICSAFKVWLITWKCDLTLAWAGPLSFRSLYWGWILLKRANSFTRHIGVFSLGFAMLSWRGAVNKESVKFLWRNVFFTTLQSFAKAAACLEKQTLAKKQFLHIC